VTGLGRRGWWWASWRGAGPCRGLSHITWSKGGQRGEHVRRAGRKWDLKAQLSWLAGDEMGDEMRTAAASQQLCRVGLLLEGGVRMYAHGDLWLALRTVVIIMVVFAALTRRLSL
jgi:hypothetical protein